MRIMQILFVALVAGTGLIRAEASMTTMEKLEGPVTRFLEAATRRHTLYIVDPSKKISYLHWRGLPGEKPLVIVPGRSEVAELWAETAYDFVQGGHKGDIYVWDPPGQGLSDRMLPRRPDVGHIDRFDNYVAALTDFLHLVAYETGRAPSVIAHSMGGAIALLTLQRDPYLAQDLILVAPMLDINFGRGVMDLLVSRMVQALDILPFIRMRTINRGNGNVRAKDSSRAARLAFHHGIHTELGTHLPRTTVHWIAEAHRAVKRIIRDADKTQLPVLAFVAEKDNVVDAAGAFLFGQRCGQLCEVEMILRARHAIHEEGDRIRNRFIDRALAWLQAGVRACDFKLRSRDFISERMRLIYPSARSDSPSF